MGHAPYTSSVPIPPCPVRNYYDAAFKVRDCALKTEQMLAQKVMGIEPRKKGGKDLTLKILKRCDI
jgi:hypothetical protein